jgi:hypothetical protein
MREWQEQVTFGWENDKNKQHSDERMTRTSNIWMREGQEQVTFGWDNDKNK